MDLIQALPTMVSTVGIVSLTLMSIVSFLVTLFCVALFSEWCIKRLLQTFKVYMHFLGYVRDRMRGTVHLPISMVIVTADDGWQACYLQGRKFHEAERLSPWDEGMRRAGCTVTNQWAKQSWLDARGGSYPQCLKEVEFDADPDE